jgi:hypothetical protein
LIKGRNDEIYEVIERINANVSRREVMTLDLGIEDQNIPVVMVNRFSHSNL